MSRFSPYVNNGGTALAISGKDYAVVGADTRLSLGYSILSRDVSKICQLTDKCVIATSGMRADTQTLHKILKLRMVQYEQKHKKQMSTTAVAQMLSNLLYSRRFMPFYTFNVLAGIDDEGVGAVFSYDAIGSYERTPFSSSGTGQGLVQPVMDNQVAFKQQPQNRRDLGRREAIDLVKDIFTSAGERDIYTGDWVDIAVIDETGVHVEKFELRFD